MIYCICVFIDEIVCFLPCRNPCSLPWRLSQFFNGVEHLTENLLIGLLGIFLLMQFLGLSWSFWTLPVPSQAPLVDACFSDHRLCLNLKQKFSTSTKILLLERHTIIIFLLTWHRQGYCMDSYIQVWDKHMGEQSVQIEPFRHVFFFFFKKN